VLSFEDWAGPYTPLFEQEFRASGYLRLGGAYSRDHLWRLYDVLAPIEPESQFGEAWPKTVSKFDEQLSYWDEFELEFHLVPEANPYPEFDFSSATLADLRLVREGLATLEIPFTMETEDFKPLNWLWWWQPGMEKCIGTFSDNSGVPIFPVDFLKDVLWGKQGKGLEEALTQFMLTHLTPEMPKFELR
jgi:hypothetical protein